MSQTPTLLPLRLHYRGRVTHLEKERKRSHPEMEGAQRRKVERGQLPKRALFTRKAPGRTKHSAGEGDLPWERGLVWGVGLVVPRFPHPEQRRVDKWSVELLEGGCVGGSAGRVGLSFANLK